MERAAALEFGGTSSEAHKHAILAKEINNEELTNGRRELLELNDATFVPGLSIDKRFDMPQKAKRSISNGKAKALVLQKQWYKWKN